MSLKTGLIGFGMSAAVIAGGGVAIHEWSHDRHVVGREKACVAESNAGKLACQDVVTSPDIIEANEDTAKVYGYVGGLSLIVGGIGVIASFNEAIDSEPIPQMNDSSED